VSTNTKKVLSKSFVENHKDVTEDVAAELIVRASQEIKKLSEEKRGNEKIMATKQILQDLNSGYNSAIRYEQAKINFLLEKIDEIESGDVNPSSGANS
jgi:hypothetical protein